MNENEDGKMSQGKGVVGSSSKWSFSLYLVQDKHTKYYNLNFMHAK